MRPETIAALAAISYALFTVFGWFGLQYSNPLVATLVSLCVRTLALWAAVFFTGGVPDIVWLAFAVFFFLGVMQTATSLLTFIGLQKIGTSRSQPLRNSYPLWSALIAITVMREPAGPMILAGTLLVVIGVILISWKPEASPLQYRRWHVLYSLGAGVLAGIAFPLRRYGLTLSNQPVFLGAVVAIVSFGCAVPYLVARRPRQEAVWHAKAILHFTASGFFEALGALLSLVALASGRVVVVSPIVATTPLWNLLIAIVFLRGREDINVRTVCGTIGVVVGTMAIAWG